MNRFEFFSNLEKFKYVKHSSSGYRPSGTNAYIAKIDDFYGKGKHRYFYTKEEWENYKKNKEYAQNAAAEKADKETPALKKAQSGREAAIKTSQENYKKTTKEEEAKRIALYKELSDPSSDKYDYEKAIEVFKDFPEVKQLKNELENAVKEHWPNNKFKYPITMLNEYVLQDEEGNYTGIYDDLRKKYPDSAALMAVWDTINDAVHQALQKGIYERNVSSREAAMKQGQKATREQNKLNALTSDNPETVQAGVKMEIDDYKKYLQNKKDEMYARGYALPDEKYEIIAGYENYLLEMSNLRSKEEKDPKTGMPLISTDMSLEETMKYVNPGRDIPFAEYQNQGNCTLCTLALDLRNRGYDVSAPNISEAKKTGYENISDTISMDPLNYLLNVFNLDDDEWDAKDDSGYMTRLYKGDIKVYSDDDSEKLKETLSKQPNTSGNFGVTWNEASYGHSMYYKIDSNGNIEIYDAQINQKVDLDEILSMSHDWEFTRTDNLEPNWEYIIAHNCTVYK